MLNNPLSNIDPLGLDCIYVDNDTGQQKGFNRGDCDNSTEALANSGYYVDGKIVGGANGINNSNYGTAGPDGTLNFYVQGQTDPNSICVTDCTGAIGGVSADSSNLPASGPVVINAPFAQTVSVLGQAGITPVSFPFNLGHGNSVQFRDSNPVCSVHLLLDPSSGQNGQPTTGSYHLDEYNPLTSLGSVPAGGVGLPIPLAPFHAAADWIPDKINDTAGRTVLTPGRNSCTGKP